MPSKQGNCGNRVTAKKVTVYALLTALCIVLGYLELVLSLSFIAPGVKIGLANSVALILSVRGDIKGAFLVNISRILLSTLLFASPFSLVYSLIAGVVSLLSVAVLRNFKSLSVVGISMASATVHNIAQIAVAAVILGKGVIYYLPALILSGFVCGLLVGIISDIFIKKIETNIKF